MNPTQQPLARFISIALHPFAVTLLLVGISAWHLLAGRSAAIVLAIVGAVAVIPAWWFSARQVARGEWSHIDATRRTERGPLYILGIASVGATAVALWLLPGASPMLRGVAAGGAMLLAGAIVNRWLKISLHVAFAAFAGVTLLRVDRPVAVALLLAVPLLAWSRIALRRHTPVEVAAGVVLGALPAAIAMAL